MDASALNIYRTPAPRSPLPGLVAVCALSLLFVACGARKSYVASEVTVDQIGWDTLVVAAAFTSNSLVGTPEPVTPEAISVTLFDAAFDTLLTSTAGTLVFDDAQRGDREPLRVEVCGRIQDVVVCEQRTVQASPKRVHLDPTISYPLDLNYEIGQYRLPMRWERQHLSDSTWHSFSPESWSGFLEVQPVSAPDQRVRIPLRDDRGRFNLSQVEDGDDLVFHIRSALRDADELDLRFAVFLGLGALPPRETNAIVIPLRKKTEEERVEEVGAYVEEAAEQLFDLLNDRRSVNSPYAFVNAWQFNTLRNEYVVDLELNWRAGVFRGGWHELLGRLTVKANGQDPVFVRTRSNRRAERVWSALTDQDQLALRDFPQRESQN